MTINWKEKSAKLFDLSKLLILLVVVISTGLVLLTTNVNAQKRKSRKITKKEFRNIPLRAEIVVGEPLCVPGGKDYFSILQVDKDSNLSLTAQTENNSKTIISNHPLSALKEVLSKADKTQSTLVVKL